MPEGLRKNVVLFFKISTVLLLSGLFLFLVELSVSLFILNAYSQTVRNYVFNGFTVIFLRYIFFLSLFISGGVRISIPATGDKNDDDDKDRFLLEVCGQLTNETLLIEGESLNLRADGFEDDKHDNRLNSSRVVGHYRAEHRNITALTGTCKTYNCFGKFKPSEHQKTLGSQVHCSIIMALSCYSYRSNVKHDILPGPNWKFVLVLYLISRSFIVCLTKNKISQPA